MDRYLPCKVGKLYMPTCEWKSTNEGDEKILVACQENQENARCVLRPGVTQAPLASMVRTLRIGARGTCPMATTMPLSSRRSPYMISVPFFSPVHIVASLMRVAGVSSSNRSDTVLSRKFEGGPGLVLRAAHRMRICCASSGVRREGFHKLLEDLIQ